MGTISTQYNVGDTVYIVVDVRAETAVACPICSSTGKVTLSGQEFQCPACGGQKTRGAKTRSAVAATVLQIQVSKCEERCQVLYTMQHSSGRASLPEVAVFATEAAAIASMGG